MIDWTKPKFVYSESQHTKARLKEIDERQLAIVEIIARAYLQLPSNKDLEFAKIRDEVITVQAEYEYYTGWIWTVVKMPYYPEYDVEHYALVLPDDIQVIPDEINLDDLKAIFELLGHDQALRGFGLEAKYLD